MDVPDCAKARNASDHDPPWMAHWLCPDLRPDVLESIDVSELHDPTWDRRLSWDDR